MAAWQENITPHRFEGQTVMVAAGTAFLLSRDGTNINGVVLASDNGWNAV
ncbi:MULTISPECIES: hypothetical protein [Micrococcaceae]|jgi:hypothetical protein|nr:MULTISPECIES: hypothetical protein [Micrococcaceae]UEL27062.1 hypothetical protein KTR40_10370 [Pseudarthrobacter sp. L1SW]